MSSELCEIVQDLPEEDTRYTQPKTKSQNALTNSAQIGHQSQTFVLLIYDENIIAWSHANDPVKRELLWTLPIEAKNTAAVMAVMNVVAAAAKSIAWNQNS